MRDIYREYMVRSFKDAADVCETVEEEYGITVPPEAYPQMALALYRHRIQSWRYRAMEDKEEFPDGTPDRGLM